MRRKSFVVVTLSVVKRCVLCAAVCQVRKTSQAAMLLLLEHSLISKGLSNAALAACVTNVVADIAVICAWCGPQAVRLGYIHF